MSLGMPSSAGIASRHISKQFAMPSEHDTLTPIAKKSVKAKLPSQAAVNGRRSFEVICLK